MCTLNDSVTPLRKCRDSPPLVRRTEGRLQGDCLRPTGTRGRLRIDGSASGTDYNTSQLGTPARLSTLLPESENPPCSSELLLWRNAPASEHTRSDTGVTCGTQQQQELIAECCTDTADEHSVDPFLPHYIKMYDIQNMMKRRTRLMQVTHGPSVPRGPQKMDRPVCCLYTVIVSLILTLIGFSIWLSVQMHRRHILMEENRKWH